eukprot:14829296-Ditylum_brightwellii.AAC.1
MLLAAHFLSHFFNNISHEYCAKSPGKDRWMYAGQTTLPQMNDRTSAHRPVTYARITNIQTKH